MKNLYRRLGLVIFFLGFVLSTFSNPINPYQAERAALRFMKEVMGKTVKEAKMVSLSLSNSQMHGTYTNAFYVFNVDDYGFVIVAGDDQVKPILGYSTESYFDPDRIPENMQFFLKEIKNQIEYAVTNQIEAGEQIQTEWRDLLSDIPRYNNQYSHREIIRPLLSTTWDQNRFYNHFCPSDTNGPGGHVYAGCVATTLAQIINYWKYPTSPSGSHTYTDNNYGQQSVAFNNVHYDYSTMPDRISYHWQSSTQSYVADDTAGMNAIATLIYHCGIAVNMGYGADGSGAYDVAARVALIDYFHYNPYLNIAYKSFFSNEEWETLIKTDLNAGRPVYYSGSGTGGHAFVCDGYDANNYFHFNWGWSGSYNGYFVLSALTPASGHNYSNNQSALLNVYPVSDGMTFPPAAPSNMIIETNDQLLSATITWTNPSTTLNDSPLTSLTSIVVKRNGVVVHTVANPIIGNTETWVDNTISFSGNYAYEVVAMNEQGLGIPVYGTVSVGQLCNLTVQLLDSYGDGWNGASIEFYSNGMLQGTVSLPTGDSASIEIALPQGAINCVWVPGNDDRECSFTIFNTSGVSMYSVNIGNYQSTIGTFPINFYSFTHVCPSQTNVNREEIVRYNTSLQTITPQNRPQQILVHNIAGTSSHTIRSSALIAHPLGFNRYTGTNYSNSFYHQMVLYPENNEEQLLLEVLQRSGQSLNVYDGVGTLGTQLLALNNGNAFDYAPVISTTGAITLEYRGNWHYSGFQVRVSTVSCLPGAFNFNCTEKEATYAILNWEVFNDAQWQGHSFNWQLEYGISGFTPGTGTRISSTDTFAILSGLHPETSYEAYLSYRCANGDTNQIGPCFFTTYPLSECYPSIGSGTNTSSYYPLNTNSDHVFTQQIFTAEELAIAGITAGNTLNRLSFHCEGRNEQRIVMNPITVYIGNTTQNSFTSAADSIPRTAMQQVYSGSMDLESSNSDFWVSLFLDTTFLYTGGNIVIAIEKPNNVNGNNIRFYVHNTSNNCAMSISDYATYVNTDRSNIRFCAVASCMKPTGVQLIENESGNVVLQWNPGYEETKWHVEYGFSGFTRGTGITMTVDTVPQLIFENLERGVYDFYIQADCGNAEVSHWISLLAEPVEMICETMGTGAEINEIFPIGYYSQSYNCYTQQIFTANELRDMGWQQDASVYSLAFQYVGTSVQVKDSITVYLGNTTQGVFGTWVSTNCLQEVYKGSVYLSNEGWVAINFDTTFIWDGTSNVVVAMLNNSGIDNRTSAFAMHPTEEPRAREHCQSSSINPRTIGGNGAIHSQRNNMRFCISNTSCLTPQNIVLQNSENGIILSWDSEEETSEWNVEYGPTGFLHGEGTLIQVANTPTVTISNLSTGYYDFYVQADCGGQQSFWGAQLNEAINLNCNHQLGEGTTTNNLFPFDLNNNYSYTQEIYTAAELTAMGLLRDDKIHSIAFRYYNENTNVAFMIDPVTVYMANTAQTNLSSWIPMVDLAQVYAGSVTAPNTVNNGWITIVLDQPYSWDGYSNLVIATYKEDGAVQEGNGYTFYTHTAGVDYSRSYTSSSTFDIASIQNAGNTYDTRNNIRFCISEATCYAPRFIQTANITDTSAILSWNRGETENNWEIEYGLLGFERGEGYEIRLTDTVSYLTGLTPNRTYEVYLRSNCGMENSSWRRVVLHTLQRPALLPYSHSFEDEMENQEWLFANENQVNKWHIGSGAHNNSAKGLYISGNNGVNNSCTSGYDDSYVYAYRSIYIPDSAQYMIQYDWHNEISSSRGYMRVFLVPASVMIDAVDNGIGTNSWGNPENWIPADMIDPYTYGLHTSREWQTYNGTITVPIAGQYNLVFYWYNHRRVEASMIAGAIDNVIFQGICQIPTGVRAIAGGDSVTLSWNPVVDASGYHLYKDNHLIAEYIGSTQYIDRNLFYETEYCYTITSVKNTCESKCSDTLCVTTGISSFETPTGLTAVASDNRVSLTWNSVSNASYYTLYRDGVALATVATPSYLDTALAYATDYCYRITATGPTDISAPSVIACVRTANCNPVRNLIATVRNVEVDIQWEEPEGAETLTNSPYYTIYRNGFVLDTTSSSSYTDLVTNTGTYQYCVEFISGNCIADLSCTSVMIDHLSCGTPGISLHNVSDSIGYKVAIQVVEVVGATSYRLYKDGVAYRHIVDPNMEIIDNDIYPGIEYCYTLTALCVFNEDTIESQPSIPVCTTVDCNQAPHLSGTVNGKVVMLSWSRDAGIYNIYRNNTKITPNNGYQNTTYVDAGTHLQEGETYCYTIVAYCHTGDSLISNPVCITIDSCTSYTYLYDTICEGENYRLYDFNETEAGVYRHHLINELFCDSIVILHLTVNPIYHIVYQDEVCQGTTYQRYGFSIPADSLQTPGIFTTQYVETTKYGCDSIVSLALKVNPIYHIVLSDKLCLGEAYSQYGFVIPVDSVPVPGNYTFERVLSTNSGCDSVVSLSLEVMPPVMIEQSLSICDHYIWNEQTYTQSGTYIQQFASAFGCDSTVTLHLTILNDIAVSISDTICEQYEWNGQIYTQSGAYTQIFTAANQCDSIVTLYLTVSPSYDVEFEITATEKYTWNDTIYTESGDYSQVFTSIHGCDSIVTLHLTVLYPCDVPENLSAIIDDNRHILLTWSPSSSALSYNVLRNNEELATNITTLSYEDANVNPNTQYCYQVQSVCADGTSEWSESICVNTQVSINEPVQYFRMYPIPASTTVTIEYGQVQKVMIYTAVGQLVKTIDISGEPIFSINVSDYVSGVYVFKMVTYSGYEFSRRVTVKR